MKNTISTIFLFLMSLPAIAATAEAHATDATVEPLGTFYVVCIGLVFIGLLVGFCLYYMRWDEEEDRPDQKP